MLASSEMQIGGHQFLELQTEPTAERVSEVVSLMMSTLDKNQDGLLNIYEIARLSSSSEQQGIGSEIVDWLTADGMHIFKAFDQDNNQDIDEREVLTDPPDDNHVRGLSGWCTGCSASTRIPQVQSHRRTSSDQADFSQGIQWPKVLCRRATSVCRVDPWRSDLYVWPGSN